MGNKQIKQELNEEDIKFFQANTSLSRVEILEWFKNFKNDCPDGVLTRKQFVTFYKQLLPKCGDPEKFCDHMFKAFDTNDSNSIDFNEFLLAFSITARGNLEERLNWSFSLYDYDDNDYIDCKELAKVLEAIYELQNVMASEEQSAKNRAKTIFKKLDLDNNNKISRQEFVKGLMGDDVLRSLLAPKF